MAAPMASLPAGDASFRGVARLLAALLPDVVLPPGAEREPSLESLARPLEPARVISAAIIEGRSMRAHAVERAEIAGFAAFLDGRQSSRAVYFTADGAPIVHGTAAAVVRIRRDRRLYTWRHSVEPRLYADRGRVPSALWSELVRRGLDLRDTHQSSDAKNESSAFDHPFALRDAAIHCLQKDREAAEERLAIAWCSSETRPILIDGGISGSEPVAHSALAIGVVKSHRTLYADGDALVRVLALECGERSSVFRVTSPKRVPVASWYLRIRDRVRWDPMWGLVRVEAASIAAPGDRAIAARADCVSGWILAEATPIALPDARWDKMVYGIGDCEEFLKAVT
ncbi:MAG TPA: hypothetical protein VHV78_15640 [Gemmatimonadaceae bacterium]|jgi:hypothetical protein|nr:hypothetical protein [Gemmatimonadaceae bacterium]